MTITRCSRCGRPLRHPVSIARGMGPTCAAKALRSAGGVPGGQGHKSAKQVDQSVCPDCGSQNVSERKRENAHTWWNCQSCGRVWICENENRGVLESKQKETGAIEV